jgi:hypothetical protein
MISLVSERRLASGNQNAFVLPSAWLRTPRFHQLSSVWFNQSIAQISLSTRASSKIHLLHVFFQKNKNKFVMDALKEKIFDF